MPNTNHVSRVQNFAAALWLQCKVDVHIMLFHITNVVFVYFSTFRIICEVTNMVIIIIIIIIISSSSSSSSSSNTGCG